MNGGADARRRQDRLTAGRTPDSNRYSWGADCDGWRLLDADDLSVTEEQMPPGAAEQRHAHRVARQFFYVLAGRARMRLPDGDVDVPAGAGVHVPPGLPHQICNVDNEPVRFLVVSSPTTRRDRHNHELGDDQEVNPGTTAAH